MSLEILAEKLEKGKPEVANVIRKKCSDDIFISTKSAAEANQFSLGATKGLEEYDFICHNIFLKAKKHY